MFALTPGDLSGTILDCAAGPASSNAELAADGYRATSCDPLYCFTAGEIRSSIDAVYDTMVANVRAASDEFVWREFDSPEHLGGVPAWWRPDARGGWRLSQVHGASLRKQTC
jgi:hypothetical protein